MTTSVGFQVFGSSGGKQIDQDYFNMSLVSKGSVVIQSAGSLINPNLSFGLGTFSITGIENPIICVQTGSNTVPVVILATRSGNTLNYQLRTTNPGSTFIGQTVNYWVFDNTHLASPVGPNVGLQVFKADGSVAFDNRIPIMRIVSVTKMADAPSRPFGTAQSMPDTTISLPTGQYAAFLSHFRVLVNQTPSQSLILSVDGLITTSSSVKVVNGQSELRSFTGDVATGSLTGGILFICDVSGM